MAATFTEIKNELKTARGGRLGGIARIVGDLDLGVYATGGVEVDADLFNATGQRLINVSVASNSDLDQCVFTPAADEDADPHLMRVIDVSGAVEIANATNLAAKPFRVTVEVEVTAP